MRDCKGRFLKGLLRKKRKELGETEYSFDGWAWTFRSKEDALKHFKDEGFVEALIKAGYIKFSKQ